MPPITKTLWTCNVEAVLEYIRIVYDTFPSDKLLQIIVSDVAEHVLGSWKVEDQNLQQFMNGLADLPQVTNQTSSADCNLMRGLTKAMEALTQTSQVQSKLGSNHLKVS